ncbi:MAG: hypothetical protein MJ145_04910, partial [Clostridia bacterium]|nr:hypothetical protein [Clostridia bacterium]
TVKEKNVALKIASPMGDIYLDHASITEICGKLGDKDLQFDLNKKSSSSSENAYSLEFKKSGTSDTFVLNSSKVELTLPLPKDAVSSPAATRKSGNFTYKIDGKDAEFDKESKLAKLKLDQTKEFSVLSNKAAEKQIRASIKLSTVKLNKVSASSDGKIKLTISKGDGNTPTYYYVYRSTKKSSGYKKIGSVKYLSKDTYTYTNSTNLKKGTKYYYKVRGYYKSDGVVVYTKYSTVKYATCKKTRK